MIFILIGVVAQTGVEPACRLFHGHCYSPTPGQPWAALTDCQSLIVEEVGVEPTLTTIALGASVYNLHVAEITRSAVGV